MHFKIECNLFTISTLLMQTAENPEYEVGDEMFVECTSFSTKGVPVMSLVKDD